MEEVLLKRVSEKTLNHCADMLKAVAHPVRITIIDLLGVKGPLSVTEIHTALEMEQSAISHHLGILRKIDLLECKKEGKKIFYRITKPELLKIIRCIENCAT